MDTTENTPEPVPTTNRAGEVERIKQYIADLLSVVQPFANAAERADQVNAERDPNGDTVYPWNYVNSSHFADAFAIYSEGLDPADWEAFNKTEQTIAALATQPATSQEGEICKLYAIVDAIANADDDDTISCLYVNISDGRYSRQWLRDAARDALLSRVSIETASLTDVEEIKNILFKYIRYEATTEYQLGGVTGHSEAAEAVVLAINAKKRGYETARPALATTPATSQVQS